MSQIKYKIYRLSARAIIGYGKEQSDGSFKFQINQKETSKCILSGAQEQDDNALFYQIMDELYGGVIPSEDRIIEDLADVIAYVDFSGIFDRNNQQKRYADRQQKAASMFRPDGITLDFGSGAQRYVAFERSASMSRRAMLSFIRADLYEPIRRRIMLDLEVGMCQLSKLYAYNGLMMSSGKRMDGIGIDAPHRVIVVENTTYQLGRTKVITVEDDGTGGSMRKFRRVEKYMEDYPVMAFDGEGLISKSYADVLNKALGTKQKHTSFQIRMPYVKGMLHQVDFKDFLKEAGTTTITDLWGVEHNVSDVDIILTKSMFKGAGWLKENGKSWDDYWEAFRKYHHALYITNVSKAKPEATTELNFQFLNTLSISAEEFRPEDLPLGWTHSPEEDSRDWLTKETELAYYNLCANEKYRITYFTNLSGRRWGKRSREEYMADILKKNPLFIAEPPYVKKLEAEADGILTRYSRGKLMVAGDNRFLSGDLLDLLRRLIDIDAGVHKKKNTFFNVAILNRMQETTFYAPKPAYKPGKVCTILRNPHIARNEEIQLQPYTEENQMRRHYLGHLTDVIMVDTHVLAAQRLGGADYDGDMVRTIASPLVNRCVQRNYGEYAGLANMFNIPLLHIPTVDPMIRNASDWQARFETVKNTFSSRVGQISNAALNRGIIAYNENSSKEERERYRQEVETLAILTGLEIDSSKSGVKPDLSQYLSAGNVGRSRFLRFKDILDSAEEQRKWYEPTAKERLKSYYEKTDWTQVNSNLERLPYLAYQLEVHTPKIKAKRSRPSQLYTFAAERGWEKRLDADVLVSVRALAQDYQHCLQRIRASRKPIQQKLRQSDIERILYGRGQEEDVDPETLYAIFSALPQERIEALYHAIREQQWHMMGTAQREAFLYTYLPEEEFHDYFDLLTDFRSSGYRILGDLVCDCMDAYRLEKQQKLHSTQDSAAMTAMLDAYLHRYGDYKEAVQKECRRQLEKILKPSEAVKYGVALKDSAFLWDILYDKILDHVKKGGSTNAE